MQIYFNKNNTTKKLKNCKIVPPIDITIEQATKIFKHYEKFEYYINLLLMSDSNPQIYIRGFPKSTK